MASNADSFNKTNDSPPRAGARRTARAAGALLLLGALLFAVTNSIVFVDETEFVIIERLGEITAVYDRPEDRGCHFKLPWPIETSRSFDRRIHLFDPPGREIFTRDKKNITVDAYVCWKIAESASGAAEPLTDRPVVRFFRSLGDVAGAENRIDSRLRSILGPQIGQVELGELLSVVDSEQGPDEQATGQLETICESVRSQVDARPGESGTLRDRLGIEIVDVRIKRLNLPTGNQQAVFERMKSERRKIADRYRSAGMAENKVIRSQADRQYAEILARSSRRAEEIRGAAEAESIGILNRAHAQDPELYGVIQKLDTYRKILNDKTTLVLSASSNLLKLLTDGLPDAKDVTEPKPSSESEPDVEEKKVSQANAPASASSVSGGSGR